MNFNMRRPRLSGWQRIGAVLSVLWVMAVGAFTLHDVSAIEQHYPIDYAALAAAAGGYTMLPSSPTFGEWLLQNQLSTSLKEWADRRTEQIETKPTPEQEQSYLQWRDSIYAEYKREMTVDAEQDFHQRVAEASAKEIRDAWQFAGNLIMWPLLVFWTLPYIVRVTWRWVRRGFAQQKAGAV